MKGKKRKNTSQGILHTTACNAGSAAAPGSAPPVAAGDNGLLRAILEEASDVIYIHDLEGHFSAVNPAAEKFTGYSRSEIIGMNIRDILAPDCSDLAFRMIAEGVAGISSTSYQLKIVRKNGERAQLAVHTRVQKNGEKPVSILGVGRDTAGLRKAGAENTLLMAAVEKAADALVVTDRDGKIQYVNPAFTRLTGFSVDEAVGNNIRMVGTGRHERSFFTNMWKTLLAGEAWRGEVINRRKDGSHYLEEMTITPVQGANGEIRHFVALKKDMGEHKLLQEQLWQARKMEAIGRLAGGVAHDFNNLLTVIKGYSELLLLSKARLDETMRGYVEEIRKAGERASALTSQLLAFGRRQILTPKVIDLNAVLRNMERMLRPLVGENVELQACLDGSLGRVKADQGQIEQVVVNLVVNAKDAIPRSGRITISTSNVELDRTMLPELPVNPGPYVLLSVRDTGLGMDAESRARLFEPFYTTKELGKGTGLGLATVYGIVKQSGGYIWVDSEPGKGTLMRVYLPRTNEALSKAPAPLEQPFARGGKETILLVEDEEGVRSLAKNALVSRGYKVLTAGSGEEALEVARKHSGPIDLLLTDVVMPGISGHEAADRLVQDHETLKVLYMSGYTEDAIVRHGVLDAEVALLKKPFTPGILARRVREILDAKPCARHRV